MSKTGKSQIIITTSDMKRFKKMSDEEIQKHFNKKIIPGVLSQLKSKGEPDPCILVWKYRF